MGETVKRRVPFISALFLFAQVSTMQAQETLDLAKTCLLKYLSIRAATKKGVN